MSEYIKIEIKINGKLYTREVPPNLTLLDFLRDYLHLTGTKESCGEGECGACSVIMDGILVNSCLILAAQADKTEILTIEGINKENPEIQKSFAENGAIQCGYCIPGMIMASKALLDKNPEPTREEIKKGLSGNFCRCTGYEKIIKAVEKISKVPKK